MARVLGGIIEETLQNAQVRGLASAEVSQTLPLQLVPTANTASFRPSGIWKKGIDKPRIRRALLVPVHCVIDKVFQVG